MRNLSLKLVFIIFVFATVMAGSVAVANLYAEKVKSIMAVETQTKAPTFDYVEPSAVKSSREHIDEQLAYGRTVVESVDSSEEYVQNAIKAVDFYERRLKLPLPYELLEPNSKEEKLNTVLYRPQGDSGELSRFQEKELIRVKKERLEGYHLSLIELERRSTTPVSSEQVEQELYLNSLAEELPFYVPPIVVGNACGGSDTLGCYYHSDEIEITPLALNVNGGNDECLILATIAHETRHYNQFLQSGVSDYILEDLEDDANEFMRDNTPERCKAPTFN